MMKRTQGRSIAWMSIGSAAIAAMSIACSADGGSHEVSADESIDDADVAIGSRGAAVRALCERLSNYGYLPNELLASRYPNWVPVVDRLPEDPNVFDEVLERAVIGFQRQYGLEPTGVVDAITRELIEQPRCGWPDSNPAESATAEKFSFLSQMHEELANAFLTYRFLSYTNDISASNQEAAMQGSARTWTDNSRLTINGVTTVPELSIRFFPSGSPPAGWGDFVPGSLAYATTNSSGEPPRIAVNDSFLWDTTTPVPMFHRDLQSVLVHELGHIIGLDHSSIPDSIMYPGIASGVARRSPTRDDITAVGALWKRWIQDTTVTARDVGGGGGNAVWVIGSSSVAGGFDIRGYSFTESRWVTVSGGATRIDVGPDRVPWIVNNAGSAYRRLSWSPLVSANWQKLPGSHFSDIGVRAGGTGSGAVYASRDATTDSLMFFNQSTSQWESVAGAPPHIVAVDVDHANVPWVVTSSGTIHRKRTNAWEQLPGSGLDIGVDGAGYVWLIGSDGRVFLWIEQNAFNLVKGAPMEFRWYEVGGIGTRISATGDGTAWVVTSSGQTFLRGR
jgi:peptidoglycan hydrolase-like protein with peptidoglycan-binding domain